VSRSLFATTSESQTTEITQLIFGSASERFYRLAILTPFGGTTEQAMPWRCSSSQAACALRGEKRISRTR
jgi:hypothetical protein